MNIEFKDDSVKVVLAERRILSLLCIFRNLKVLNGTAIIADAPGGLCELFANAAGLKINRYASRFIVERFGYWVESWMKPESLNEILLAPEEQNAVLAERSGRLVYSFPVEAGLELSPPPNVVVHMEPISEAISNSRNPVLIVLNDIEPIVAIANQVEECLGDICPVLMFNPNGVPEKSLSQLFSCLESLGYCTYNELLEPFRYWEEGGGVKPMQCIALHPEVVTLPDVSEFEELLKLSHSFSQMDRLHGKAKLFSYTPESVAWVRTAIADGEWRLPLEGLGSLNWYEVEMSNNSTWRWSGPGTEARMLIPLPMIGDYLLEFCIQDVANSDIGKEIRFYLDGELIQVPETGVQPGNKVLVPFSVDKQHWSGWSELLIALPHTLNVNPDDFRFLGVSLDCLNLRWRDA